MLYFITMGDNKFTIDIFLWHVQDRLGFPAAILSYEEAALHEDFKDAVVIFCDIERFTEGSLVQALDVYNHIKAHGARCLLNHPQRVLRRFELLTELHQLGINDFNVYRQPQEGIRYPVFLRNELDHQGPVSGLLASPTELADALQSARGKTSGPFSPLITEYCDVRIRDLGYHKYGAFCLMGRVVPRHLFFSDAWMVKGTKDQRPEHAQKENDYLDRNDFEKEIAGVFHTAHIDYGRVDFAQAPNGLAIFEINTNPTIMDNGDLNSNRTHVTEHFVSAFVQAMQDLYHGRL